MDQIKIRGGKVLKGSVAEYSEPTDPVADRDWEALG